jgi:threonine/homoserine/homoserine lactone efflux protein
MEVPFLLRCFLIGILAASGCGPVFVLTFNRSAVCGFWRGFPTAIGAGLADSFYFLLGLLGALAVVGELKYFMVFLDLIGGILLIALGFHSLRKMKQIVCVTIECSYSTLFALTKAFTITILNPLVILFFMAVTLQILPGKEVVSRFSYLYVLLSSFFLFLGSLAVLGTVSLVASFLGSCITTKRLRFFSGITGVAFILFGLYLFGHFVVGMAKLLPIFS